LKRCQRSRHGGREIESSQFHVTVYVTDKKSARRATEAIWHRMPITISGTVGDKLGFFTGVARSVDEDEKRDTQTMARHDP
jgi:hypothetical protein